MGEGVHPDTARFRRTAIGASAAALLVIALVFASPLGRRAAVPGPLSSNHAPLRDDCGKCHAESREAIQSMAHGLAPTELDLAQAELCLGCHELGGSPLLAHGWTREAFAADRAPESLDGAPLGPGGELACNACHQEHLGRLARLDTIDDGRCQACHLERFDDFETGHTPFADYPHDRRLEIAFDHTSHLRQHFAEETAGSAPTACTSCHVLDAAGRHMPVLSYEATCAACHDDEVRGLGHVDGSGVAFLSLPALDTFTLEEKGIAIGHWPADSMVTEVEFAPFLELLLATDEANARDLELVNATDLLDLSEASDETLAAVGRVAWEVKALFGEVLARGHQAMLARLEQLTGSSIERKRAQRLLERLPEDLIGEAVRAWVPELAEELARHAAGETLPVDSTPVDRDVSPITDRNREKWVETGGWYLQELDFAVRYRPGGHADPFFVEWIDLASSLGARGDEVFDALAAPDATGMCTKCHAVDATGDTRRVSWSPRNGRRDATLTHFSHAAHFASPSDNACLDCHVLAERTTGFMEAYRAHDPKRFVPAFRSMDVATCARCHGEAGADASCTICHDYHALRDAKTLPRSLLDALR